MSREYCAHLADMLAPWGAVTFRAMFGGFGLYRNGQIFAIVADDTLYLKVGASNRPDYEKAGSQPFMYDREKNRIAMSYWLAPAFVLEDAETLCKWAEKSYRAALDGTTPSRKKRQTRA